MKRLRLVLFLVLLVPRLHAETAATFSPSEFLGYEPGSRFTFHHRIVDWMEHLDRSSDRMQLVRYGETVEGRPLIYGIFSTPENLERLDSIRAAHRELRGATPARRDRIIRSTPAVVWLGYGIHGNESSSPEAALVVTGRLASGELDDVLRDLIVIVDPVQNPDGRERYVNWFHQRMGARPDPAVFAAEHREPWPGGRYNHYLFDMNRDWAWTTQQESRFRVAAFLEWEPQVFADLHEMGHNSTYFFPPDARPLNANLPSGTEELLELFGRANAREFTSRRWPFFVAERYDLFYPGYGDAWPSLRGTVGMTYEVGGGSIGGILVRRQDGTLLSLADRVRQHAVSSETTLRTAAAARERLLRHSWQAAHEQRTAPVRTWVLDAEAPNAHELARMLQRQGIEVRRLSTAQRIRARSPGGSAAQRSLPPGALVVSSGQPAGALVTTLMERSPVVDPEFVQVQRERVEAGERDQFFDITAWSLPLAMNVPVWEVSEELRTELVPPFTPAGAVVPESGFAWLVRPDQQDFERFLARALSENVTLRVSTLPLVRSGGGTLPAGTLVIASSDENRSRVARAIEDLRVSLISADEVWSGEGTALGSNDIVPVKSPRIALLSGERISPTSFGSLWYALDADLRMPHSVVPLDTLDHRVLRELDVVIFPDGRPELERQLGKEGVATLQQWVRNGGTIVAVKGSAEALRAKGVEISALRSGGTTEEGQEPPSGSHYRVPGAAFGTEMNRSSFLSWGVQQAPAVLLEGREFLQPTGRAADDVIVVREEEPLVAGFAWPESLDEVRGSAWLTRERVGGGQVITFAEDPFFRGFWRGTLPLLVNAIAYGPTVLR